MEKLGIDCFVWPQPTHDRTKVKFKRDAFTYDKQQDVCPCPKGNLLRSKGLCHSGSGLFWEYWAEKKNCSGCPLREKCLSAEDMWGARKLLDSYFRLSAQRRFSRCWEPEYREALKQRLVWCEGTFAIQKMCHNLTGVLRRSLEAAEDHCLLFAVAMNLKRMIQCSN